jgi:hypothetical protein
LLLTALLAPAAWSDGDVDHSPFSNILQSHVRDGRVDYAALCHDERLAEYLAVLSAVDPAKLPDEQSKLAFWINSYNAFTLKVICDDYPVESINDLHFGGLIIGTVLNKTVWDRKFIVIGGAKLSLNNIEHDIIRKEFEDPRIHFALVCAAKSCPPLRSEAFVAKRLNEQLDDQGRVFLMDESKNRFSVDTNVAYLSKILDWYGDDFGKSREQRLLAIAPFLPAEIADNITADPEAWRVSYLDYDWSLNE